MTSQVIYVDNKVNSIRADNNPPISDAGINISDDGVILASGNNLTLSEDVATETITINANFGNGDPGGSQYDLQYNSFTGPPSFGGITLGTAYQLLGMDPTESFNQYITLAGTTNQITASGSSTTITLATPQSIATSSSPTFAGLTLTSPLTVGNGGTGLNALGTAYKILGVNSGATANTYLTLGGTTHQISVSPSGTTFTFSTPQNIDTTNSPSFQNLIASGVVLNDTEGSPETVTLSAPTTVTSNWILTLPQNAGTNTYVLQTDGHGNTIWFNPQVYSAGTGLTLSSDIFSLTNPVAIANGGLHLTSVGTAYQILGTNSAATAFTNLTFAGTSNEISIGTAGTTLTFSTPQSIGTSSTPTFAALTLSGSLTLQNQKAIVFNDSGSAHVTVEAPTTISSSYSMALPVAQATANYFIQNDGAGNLGWVSSVVGTENTIVASGTYNYSWTGTPSSGETTNGPVIYTTPNDGVTHFYEFNTYHVISSGYLGGNANQGWLPVITYPGGYSVGYGAGVLSTNPLSGTSGTVSLCKPYTSWKLLIRVPPNKAVSVNFFMDLTGMTNPTVFKGAYEVTELF